MLCLIWSLLQSTTWALLPHFTNGETDIQRSQSRLVVDPSFNILFVRLQTHHCEQFTTTALLRISKIVQVLSPLISKSFPRAYFLQIFKKSTINFPLNFVFKRSYEILQKVFLENRIKR